ncbi:UDP-N-acetylmuramoyl-tripeptide--D-alanyl-D-alanine ligase [Shewanella intestini]|uniref:UDP-N-acetylmuramoyl-tripeptide--D-alanyl-D-alanine ligase n=1 Tax=Shewanella intestini TaxID=2017544 RepID=A0ABS5I6T0_9GAMM|nr:MULTISPECIES: UDP-N-acetylmuramoyl-tripeptide--D-alanyl-D-alanine ligase [Shewanella]MBR9729050.1 UDP-N-acetylmuramoyl-tripeptide--D-alanyl-D-alanine ligase [Shewanella intestini]MRG37126.1 UDP-N-acetylmuramoyl-tripeptide--D-alanyl-D-alanine ligase [Shewanella sp. XMDDZSB0408]
MISTSLATLATVLKGQLVGANVEISSVSTDSRTIESNGLFLALKGERFDGHQFIDTAIGHGAVALVVDHVIETDIPQLVVSDTHAALGQIGAWVRAQVSIKRVALTGSNGKTSVKEMVAAILLQQHKVLFTAGNFNNDIGVPLTLLRLSAEHEYGVFELGANHQGEINYTSSLVLPEVALVNNIGNAHLEGFGSQQGIAQAKAEIFNHLVADGVAIINADDAFAPFLQQKAAQFSCLSFSKQSDIQADVQAKNVTVDKLGCYGFELTYQHQRASVTLPLPGEHQVSNALAAAAICLALKIDLHVIVSGLNTLKPVKGRMQPHALGRFELIDDSYNANPSSVAAAINWLQQRDGYRCLVLGDLGELGDNAAPLHEEIGAYAKDAQIDSMFCCGKLTTYTSKAFGSEHFEQVNDVVPKLIEQLNSVSGAVTVLVKGSRSAAMERVIQELENAFGRGELV